MADITNLFKATIKALKSRHKAQGLSKGPDKSILPKKRSEFASNSRLVVNNITKLKDFLMEHRTAYLNSSSAIGIGSNKMSDAERDQIDADAEIFIKSCSDAIKSFKGQVNGNNTSEQIKEHKEAVVFMADSYLKNVCKIYSEQKAIRVKRVVDRKRIGRLQPEGKRSKSTLNADSDGSSSEKKMKENEGVDVNNETESKERTENRVPDLDEPPIRFDEEDDEISPEEAQMFEQENEELYDEMNSLIDEVKQIEGKVVEISRLQELFADKVLEQEGDIDRIADTVVGTTENIKDANEEIREAMKNNAGLRVWILFFLIVCSFSLLFLDWYNA